MGQQISSAGSSGFTEVLPASQGVKRTTTPSTGCLKTPASTQSVETKIPAIHAPPHALLQGPQKVCAVATPPLTAPQLHAAYEDAFTIPESVRKSHTLAQFTHTCSEILASFLYVSNLEVASDRDYLRRMQITHVINCCKEVVCFARIDDTITYMQLALRDGVQEDLLPFLPLVMEVVQACQRQGGRVLIHCHQGVSRSCALAIAYIMYRYRCDFQTAMAMVKAQRAICSPNAAFLCQLLEWEREVVGTAATDHGLYRLAPHASYDATTLVLKLCYQTNTRRKVILSEDRMAWLWGRGIFVFVEKGKKEVVVWKGSQCTIVDGVEQAKVHVQRMLRVLGGDDAEKAMPMTVVNGKADERGTDHFGYATELAWIETTADTVSVPDSPPVGQAQEGARCEVTTEEKPMLFLLEGTCEWEHLTNYDSDDLVASSVLLLVTRQLAYLWMGQDQNASSVERLQATAQEQLTKCGNGSMIHIEQQDAESDGFWDAFEAGY